jgi:hypothetical protein
LIFFEHDSRGGISKKINENSQMFEKWKKTSEKISLEEFKEQ